jgi:hypothetical protein
MDLNFLAVISRNDVINGPDETAWFDPDCLSGRDLCPQNRLRLWTDVVGVNLPKGIHHICDTVQTEDLFLCPADGEFAPLLDALGVGKVLGSQASLGEISKEDIPPHAKVSLPHFDAGSKVGRINLLVRFRVSDCDHVVYADLRSDGKVAGKVEDDWQWNEFVQRHQVVWRDQRHMEQQFIDILDDLN